MPKMFKPKEMVSAFSGFDNVNIRHIATRRERGLLEPTVKAEKAGSTSWYDARNAILYGLATKIENAGIPMKQAYEMANYIIDNNFQSCFSKDSHPYAIKFFGVTGQASTIFFSGEKPGNFNPDQYIKLCPVPSVTIWAGKDEMRQIVSTVGHLEFISFLNVSFIVNDCIKRLNVHQDDIDALKARSDELSSNKAEEIRAEADNMMHVYSQLYITTLMTDPNSDEHKNAQYAMQMIKEKLKL